MRWSGVGLKGTLGSGGLGVLAVWIEMAEPALYFWLLFVAVMVPFFILLFIRVDEVSPTLARNAHALAVIWYLILVGGFYRVHSSCAAPSAWICSSHSSCSLA